MSGVIDRAREILSPQAADDLLIVPKGVSERIKRGRDRMRDKATESEECLRFWRGDQYVYRAGKAIQSQSTTASYDGSSGKPRHRVRTTRNIIVDIVAHEVSAATQRVPGYEVNPTTSDAQDYSAAVLSGKVARYGYDKWHLRSVTERVVTYAVVADEGFAWPYWDSSVGPYFEEADEVTGQIQMIGQGEVKVRIFGRNECYWEPGVSFDESPWHAVEQARTLDSVREIEGFFGEPLKANAQTLEEKEVNPHAKLVLVTEYLERPSARKPEGRWLTIADNRQVCPERSFPCTDHEGNVIDEPVLHKLSYFTDPDSDRDMGLVRHLLDSQRTINDCTNKQLEMKNMMLVPKLAIQNGRLKKGQRVTDEPGQVLHIEGNGNFAWMPMPSIPSELTTLKEEAKGDMARISAQNDIPSQVESGKGISALLEKDQSRKANFIGNLAEFHSRLMRHCLYLVQKHYTEPRLLMIRGDEGIEPIRDFLGAQLRGQVDVTVLPGSIEPRTRAALEARLNSIAAMFPGRYSPEEILTALESGTAETLIKSYELDVRRARGVIQKIKDGTFYATPQRPVFPGEDPGWEVEPVYGPPQQQVDQFGQPAIDQMGQPIMGDPPLVQEGVKATTVPGWMPRPIDDLGVSKKIFADFMKGDDFDNSAPDQQSAAMAYYAACIDIEQREAAKQAQQQLEQAQGLGMSNAAKPPSTPPLPTQPQLPQLS